MSIEILEDSETGDQDESPIPALRTDLEDLIDSEARRRLEEYVGRLEEYVRTIKDAALPKEENSPDGILELPPDRILEVTPDWLLGLKVRKHPNKDDPIEFVVDLCREICEMAAVSGPYLFPDPDKEEIKRDKEENRLHKETTD